MLLLVSKSGLAGQQPSHLSSQASAPTQYFTLLVRQFFQLAANWGGIIGHFLRFLVKSWPQLVENISLAENAMKMMVDWVLT